MLASFHCGGPESVPEFYPPHSRDGEDAVGDYRLQRVEKRLSETCGKPVHGTFYHSAQRIARPADILKQRGPGAPVADAAEGDEFGADLRLCAIRAISSGTLRAAPGGTARAALSGTGRKTRRHPGRKARCFIRLKTACTQMCEGFLRHRSGGYEREGDAAGEVTSAARVIEAFPLDPSHIIGVSRPRNIAKLRVVSAARVRVAEDYGERGAARASLIDSAQDYGNVGLAARRRGIRQGRLASCGRACLSGGAAGYVPGEIAYAQGDAFRHAVHDAADGLAVGLSEYLKPEFSPEYIHNAKLSDS